MTDEPEIREVDPRQVEAFEPLPGDLLVGARRAKGLSTARAAEALNVDEALILALEENRFEDLGAPVFARGHLRKYARLLALDQESVIRAYDAAAPQQSSAALAVGAHAEAAGEARSGRRPLGLMLLAALLALGVVVWRIMQNEQPPPAAVETPVAETVRTPRPIPATPEPSPASREDTALRQAPEAREESAVPSGAPAGDGPSSEPAPGTGAAVTATAPAAATVPDAGSRPAPRPPAGESEPAPRPEPESPAAPLRAAAVPGLATLVFSFEEDSWLEVRDADGRRLAYELGREGTRRTITGRAPFSVAVGYWPGVSLTLEGETYPLPVAGRRGNTARFSVPGDPAD